MKGDIAVRAARPRELPQQTPVESEGRLLNGPTGVKPGKGRGNQPTGAGRGYVTPPSNSKTFEPASAVPLEGNRSEGIMPPNGSDVAKTMGRVPHGDDDKHPGELQKLPRSRDSEPRA